MSYYEEFEKINTNLETCLDKMHRTNFKVYSNETIYWLGKFLHAYFYLWSKSFSSEGSQEDINGEPWIKVREFCQTLIFDGKMILYPDVLTQYFKKYPAYFEGCFKQQRHHTFYSVKRNLLLKKLTEFPKQKTAQKAAIKQFYELEQ